MPKKEAEQGREGIFLLVTTYNFLKAIHMGPLGLDL